jgi:hypothetical protein
VSMLKQARNMRYLLVQHRCAWVVAARGLGKK